MANPCSEHPDSRDVDNIRKSIEEKFAAEEAQEQVRIEGDNVQIGDFSYKKVTDPQKISEEIQKQKQDYKAKNKRESKSYKEAKKERRSREKASKFQGAVGENEARRIATHALGLKSVSYDPPAVRNGGRGIDVIRRNPKSGKLVVIEAKCTQASKDGRSSLGSTRHGKQGSKQWVLHNAKLMQDPRSSLYSERNARIGKELEEQGFERMLVHMHAQSLNVTVSKGVGDRGFEPTAMFKPNL